MNKEEHMSITKCMIAGLPGSGKSTYIGALWYCLMHPEKVGNIKLGVTSKSVWIRHRSSLV